MINKTIQLSVKEYGALRMQPTGRPLTRQAIIERISLKKELLGVKSQKKIGNIWILEVDLNFYNENKKS